MSDSPLRAKVSDLIIIPPEHVTTVEQEAELLAILREVAPAKRDYGWHVEDCDTRSSSEWLDDTAHERAYVELLADRPSTPVRRRRDLPRDPLVDIAWREFEDRLRSHTERVDARAAEIRPTLTVPGDVELCTAGCVYPRARALLRAIEGTEAVR